MAIPKNTLGIKLLAERMHQYNDSYWKNEYKDMLDCFIEVVEDSVLQGDTIRLENFGMFSPKINKPRPAFNAGTGQHFITEGSIGIQFKPSVVALQRIKQKAKQLETKEAPNETTKD
jgi:nucleoid DNA-binding protein